MVVVCIVQIWSAGFMTGVAGDCIMWSNHPHSPSVLGTVAPLAPPPPPATVIQWLSFRAAGAVGVSAREACIKVFHRSTPSRDLP